MTELRGRAQEGERGVQIDDFVKHPLLLFGDRVDVPQIDTNVPVKQTEARGANAPLMRSWSWMSLFCCKCHFIIAGRPQSPWNSNAVSTTVEGQQEGILGLAKDFLSL